MPDFRCKQGDANSVVWASTLTNSDATVANLTGATVRFVMRARSQTAPTTNAAATIVSPAAGTVTYTPTATDTATAGTYAAYWLVTFAGGGIERFPTVGYMTVEIEENLETSNQTIVELDDLKDYLNIPATTRTHDSELTRFLAASVPVIENLTGPILPRAYVDETYDGGGPWISVRHRPIISVQSVIEYRGPIAYNLQQITHPDAGTIYSYLFEPSGRITRRTVGGGTTTFPPGPEAVWVSYTAGFQTIPQNVRMACLELVRVNYQQTQQAGLGPVGSGAMLSDEGLPTGPGLGFFVPGRVRELLAPNRRHPSTG